KVKLEQLWVNLLDNAVKFVKPGQIAVVDITVERKNGEWLFCVRDNGIGIEHRFFSRIFVLFQKLHTKVEYEGNGIGLALCKKIVEFHGGAIWVESDEKSGSAFYFTLPAAE
ncbi:MAG: GHKL domain-containing protein, partial [Spirochaetia bacterium]|nr:GHKL domain-containing protein [Spirochaetia bacterium]